MKHRATRTHLRDRDLHDSILVVEDDAQMRNILARGLRAYGYRTLQAADGAEALAHVHREQPDLIVSDLEMPGLDGFGLLSALRSIAPKLPVMVVSGDGSKCLGALEAGAAAFHAKPIVLSELVAEIGNILQNGTQPQSKSATCG